MAKNPSKKSHKSPHKSFRRTYREDYQRNLNGPGPIRLAVSSLGLIARNWRIFVPLIIGAVLINALLVGLMSSATYVALQDAISAADTASNLSVVSRAWLLFVSTATTGGLSTGLTEVQTVFAILIFIIIWLATIYLVRQIRAGNAPKLRDGLYNALAPFLSTLMVVLVIFIFLIPLFIALITYSAALTTGFLDTPFYAFAYFVFAALLVLFTLYLLPAGLMALVAVTTQGIYPMTALGLCLELVSSRRIRLVTRILTVALAIVICWALVLLPIILIDLGLNSVWDWWLPVPLVPITLAAMTVFSFIYLATYSYNLYRVYLDDTN
jgi:hypothetical protein